DRADFYHHNPQIARAGLDVVSFAAVSVVYVCHERHHDFGDSGAGDDSHPDVYRTTLGRWCFRSETRWRPGPVSTPVLVLFASGGLHHDTARHGRGQRVGHVFLAKENFWIPF